MPGSLAVSLLEKVGNPYFFCYQSQCQGRESTQDREQKRKKDRVEACPGN